VAEVANGSYWELHTQLVELIGDLYRSGDITERGWRELNMAVTKGSYDAGVKYLVAAGIIPDAPGLTS